MARSGVDTSELELMARELLLPRAYALTIEERRK
jgi:hypothetical protein